MIIESNQWRKLHKNCNISQTFMIIKNCINLFHWFPGCQCMCKHHSSMITHLALLNVKYLEFIENDYPSQIYMTLPVLRDFRSQISSTDRHRCRTRPCWWSGERTVLPLYPPWGSLVSLYHLCHLVLLSSIQRTN